jgi:lauroyl/myristoyl acyltransferase
VAITADNSDKPGPRPDRRRLSERFRRENPTYLRTFVSVSIARAGSHLAKLLPEAWLYAVADRLGDINYALIPGYRRNVLANLQHVHRGSGLREPTKTDVRRVFRVSARDWADLLVVPGKPVRTFDREVEMDAASKARLDQALAGGKGCVLMTAHLGAFDFIGHYLHAMGYTLLIMTGRTTSRLVFDGVTYLRQSNGLPLVEANASGVRKALQAVHHGHCAVLVNDRDFFNNGIDVPFFGKRTTLPPGAVRIARDTGAPIVPLYGERVPGGHKITIHEPFFVEKTSNLQKDLLLGLEQVVASLEKAIARIPDQWVMFQAVWPSEPPAASD